MKELSAKKMDFYVKALIVEAIKHVATELKSLKHITNYFYLHFK